MSWLNFQQMDWLAMVLVHSLWIGAAISFLLAVSIRLFNVKKSDTRYLMGTGAIGLFVAVLAVLTFWMIPGKNDTVEVFSFENTVALVQDLGAEEAKSWLTWIQSYAPVFLQTWFLGMIFLMLRLIGGYQYLLQIKRKALDEVPAEWLSSIAKIREQWGMTSEVQVLASSHIDMPMVFGHIKPVMLLPVTMLSGLSQSQLEAIFAHELAHIRRHDYIVHLAQSVIESVFFFNPFIWWMSSFVNQEREQCCDDLALSYTSDPLSYAEALSGIDSYRASMLALGLGKAKQPLLQRIRRIVEPDYTPSTSYRVFIVALLLSAGLYSFNVIVPEQKEWIDVKSDYPMATELFPAEKLYAGFLNPNAEMSKPIAVKEVLRDTVPEARETEGWLYLDSDSIEWPNDLTLDYIFPSETEWVAPPELTAVVPDVSWGVVAPYVQGDTSRFPFYEEVEVPSLFDFDFDYDLELPMLLDFDYEVAIAPLAEINLDAMNFALAPGVFVTDTTKLSEKDREELRRAKAEIRAAQEEIRKIQTEQRERIREEMSKIRELQREEWELQREEMRKIQKELQEQLRNIEPMSEEDQAKLKKEMERVRKAYNEISLDRAQELAEVARVRDLEVQSQMALVREQMKLAEKEMQLVQEEMAIAREVARDHENFHKELEVLLKSDGYLKDGETLRKLKISEDSFQYNGKKVDNRDLDKYLRLFEKRFGKLKGGNYIYNE